MSRVIFYQKKKDVALLEHGIGFTERERHSLGTAKNLKTTKVARKRTLPPIDFARKKQEFPLKTERLHIKYIRVLDETVLNNPSLSSTLSEIPGFIQKTNEFLHSLTNSNKAYKRQIEFLSKENLALSKKLEQLQRCTPSEELITVKRTSTLESSNQSVPKLNLSGLTNRGFHEEFLNQAGEFSVSWRAALNNITRNTPKLK